jgi:predicted enzyme related to lactoylglutathione lyase
MADRLFSGRRQKMDKVVHFEIPVDDTARAKEFYRSAFDWELNDQDMGGGNIYTTVITTPIDEKTQLPTEPGGINGGLMQRTPDTPSPVITIGVDGIDDTLKKVEAGGGRVVQPRTAIEGLGAFAYFKDSEGNVVGLWETI